MTGDEMQSLRERAEGLTRSAVNAWNSGNKTTALPATEAAIEVYRELLRATPNVSHDDVDMLATCWRNASTIQSDLGRCEDALVAAQEAVALYRDYPRAANLASCLNTLAVKYRALGRLDDAFVALNEAASVIWPEFLSKPQELAESLEIILRNLWEWHEEAGRSLPAALIHRVSAFRKALGEQDHSQPAGVANEAFDESDPAERILVAVAKVALREKALENDHQVLRWWCQLAELLVGLAWRVRGWHMHMRPQSDASGADHWLIVLPRDSPELAPLGAMTRAYNVLAELARGAVPSLSVLDQLTEALHTGSDEDPLIRAARAFDTAGRAGKLTLELVHEVTHALLRALLATAVALEASQPREPDATYVGDLATVPIPGPVYPTPGEAMKVLAHVVDVTSRHFDTKIIIV